MNYMTISEMKRKAMDLPCKGIPLAVTQNGTVEYVAMSFEDYQKKEQTLALLKVLISSMDDQLKGKTLLSKDLFKDRII